MNKNYKHFASSLAIGIFAYLVASLVVSANTDINPIIPNSETIEGITTSSISNNLYSQDFSGMEPGTLPLGWSIESFSEHIWGWHESIDSGGDGIEDGIHGIRYFGSPPGTVSALGFIGTGARDGTNPGSWDVAAIVRFHHDLISAIVKVEVSYSAQQWWEGGGDGNGRDSALGFAYRINGADWQIVDDLNYVAPHRTTAGDAVSPPASEDRSVEISLFSLNPQVIELAWLYDGTQSGGVGGRQGLAVTDIEVVFSTADGVLPPIDPINPGPLDPNLPATWAGYPIDEDGDVDTGDFLGKLHVLLNPWVYHYESESWIYLSEDSILTSGAWLFLPNLK